jgi:hypothetical protein
MSMTEDKTPAPPLGLDSTAGLGALVEQLAALARQPHYHCDDPWYTCPAHPEGSANDEKPVGVCDCGADTRNAAVDALQARIAGMLQHPSAEVSAAQASSGMQSAEAMGADRYRVKRTAFWWRVEIGDGQQTVGRCHTEAEAERLAAALRTAFLDGAFVVAQRNTMRELGQLVQEQRRSRITPPVPHA